jgi:hypothetical protein
MEWRTCANRMAGRCEAEWPRVWERGLNQPLQMKKTLVLNTGGIDGRGPCCRDRKVLKGLDNAGGKGNGVIYRKISIVMTVETFT